MSMQAVASSLSSPPVDFSLWKSRNLPILSSFGNDHFTSSISLILENLARSNPSILTVDARDFREVIAKLYHKYGTDEKAFLQEKISQELVEDLKVYQTKREQFSSARELMAGLILRDENRLKDPDFYDHHQNACYQIIAQEFAYANLHAGDQIPMPLSQEFPHQRGMYVVDRCFSNPWGLVAFGLVSKEGKGAPILLIQGTDSFALHPGQLLADLTENEIGLSAFKTSEGEIREWLARNTRGLLGAKKALVLGHSLGGIIAQIAGTSFPEYVAKVITFNAPGISRALRNEYKKMALKPEMIHFEHEDDLLPLYLSEGKVGQIFKVSMLDANGKEIRPSRRDAHGALSLVFAHQIRNITEKREESSWLLDKIFRCARVVLAFFANLLWGLEKKFRELVFYDHKIKKAKEQSSTSAPFYDKFAFEGIKPLETAIFPHRRYEISSLKNFFSLRILKARLSCLKDVAYFGLVTLFRFLEDCTKALLWSLATIFTLFQYQKAREKAAKRISSLFLTTASNIYKVVQSFLGFLVTPSLGHLRAELFDPLKKNPS